MGLPKPIAKLHSQEKVVIAVEYGSSTIFLVPFKNIFAVTKANDFKFGMQLGFVQVHHKITPIRKSGPSSGLSELTKILTPF